MELRITEVKANAEIRIRTRFNVYSFSVTDPLGCRGFVSGGPLSDKSHSDRPLVCGGVFSGVWLVRPPRFATAVANSGPVMGFAKCIW